MEEQPNYVQPETEGRRDYSCQFCDAILISEIYLKKHILNLHQDKHPLEIQEALKDLKGDKNRVVFSSNHFSSARNSVKSAELEKFQCQICTVTYTKKLYLDQHMRFHQNTAIPVTEQFENEMPCEFCHLTFKLKFDLEKHSAKCHQKNNSSSGAHQVDNIEYNLNPLDFLHRTETELELNIKSEPEEILSTNDNNVNKQLMISNQNNFDNKEAEKVREMVQHSDNTNRASAREFPCHLCKNKFYQKAHLLNHITFFHKETSRLDKLDMENRISNLPVYQCKVCKKILETKFDLKVHIDKDHPVINHFGGAIFPLSAEAFVCSICEIQFDEKTLRIHMKNVHGIIKENTDDKNETSVSGTDENNFDFLDPLQVKTYRCEFCGKSFKNYYFLKKHIVKEKHNNSITSGSGAGNNATEEENVEKLDKRKKIHRRDLTKTVYTEFCTFVNKSSGDDNDDFTENDIIGFFEKLSNPNEYVFSSLSITNIKNVLAKDYQQKTQRDFDVDFPNILTKFRQNHNIKQSYNSQIRPPIWYECDVDLNCQFKTQEESEYDNHLISVHGHVAQVKCKKCHLEFLSYASLARHFSSVTCKPFEGKFPKNNSAVEGRSLKNSEKSSDISEKVIPLSPPPVLPKIRTYSRPKKNVGPILEKLPGKILENPKNLNDIQVSQQLQQSSIGKNHVLKLLYNFTKFFTFVPKEYN